MTVTIKRTKGVKSDQDWHQFRTNNNHDYVNRYISFVKKVVTVNEMCCGRVATISRHFAYPAMTLTSGAVLSIQVGYGMRSTPDHDLALTYESVEVMLQYVPPEVSVPKEWNDYLETDTAVYSNLPVTQLNEFIAKNGGFVIM